jgi:MYXO-CTERM domain-containing protein
MYRTLSLLLPAAALIAPLAYAATAHAGIGACGNIHVEAEAHCETKAGIECEAECQPVAFQAQCAADLTVECGGMCDIEAEANCAVDCSGGCVADCEAQPAEFDCRGSCFADCGGSCDASCETSENSAECRASCEATCEGECSGRCEGTPPSASCEAKCEASCEGSCRAEANIDCQVDCQADGFATCEADLQGGCEVECDTEGGALFCDGQYVDHGGNLDECIDSLRAILDIEVEVWGEASCEGNSCEAEGGISCSFCKMDPENAGRDAVLGALGVVVLMGLARRRRR